MLERLEKASVYLQEKRQFFFALALMLAFSLLITGRASATTVNLTGSLGSFYSMMLGIVYGPIGIVIGIFALGFGVIMMITKHWMILIGVLIAIIIFFESPSIVLALATQGASLSGAII